MSKLCKLCKFKICQAKLGYLENMGLLRDIRRAAVAVVCILLMFRLFATAQTDDAEDGAYIGSARSDKYHLPPCEWAQKISQRNAVYFATVEKAQAAGYIPCRACMMVSIPGD